jgi:hypothetical protein
MIGKILLFLGFLSAIFVGYCGCNDTISARSNGGFVEPITQLSVVIFIILLILNIWWFKNVS